ncbi:MAG: CPBP family intramembrane metalloprotease [Clostridiales bacterium]|jgi:membrane protease YdiL (CAAX protease family)|nr:CPBP family intramembrane metalloprotease [Clostridiales bacterium]
MRTRTWEIRDFIALAVIPIQLLLRWFLSRTQLAGGSAEAIILFSVALISMIFLLMLYRDILGEHWRRFRKKLWLKVLLSIVGAAALVGVLFGARLFLPAGAAEAATNGGEYAPIPVALGMILSLVPLFVVFQEEIVFRHILFFKHKNNKILALSLFIISAVLFGLIHAMNFGGNIVQTIPYMFAGAFLGLIYLVGKNIWFAIGAHLVFNFTMATLPAIAVPIMQLFIG